MQIDFLEVPILLGRIVVAIVAKEFFFQFVFFKPSVVVHQFPPVYFCLWHAENPQFHARQAHWRRRRRDFHLHAGAGRLSVLPLVERAVELFLVTVQSLLHRVQLCKCRVLFHCLLAVIFNSPYSVRLCIALVFFLLLQLGQCYFHSVFFELGLSAFVKRLEFVLHRLRIGFLNDCTHFVAEMLLGSNHLLHLFVSTMLLFLEN